MRGRPRKEPKNESHEVLLRRAKGREAQRKLRLRTSQSISNLQDKISTTENIVEQMTKLFLRFAEESLAVATRSGDLDMIKSFKACGNDFLVLVDKAHQIFTDDIISGVESKDQYPDMAEGQVVGMQTSTLPSFEIQAPEFVKHIPSASLVSTSSTKAQHMFRIDQNRRRSPAPMRIVQLLTLRPLLVADYFDADGEELFKYSFWRRLLCNTMMRGARELSRLKQSYSYGSREPSSWLLRSHKFSLGHASATSLLFFTNAALSTIPHNDHQPQYPDDRGSNRQTKVSNIRVRAKVSYFDEPEIRRLGTLVKHDMAVSGVIREDMLDAGGVEDYLYSKGMIGQSENELQLKIATAPYRSKLVTVNIPRLINLLTDVALCVGDGIAFPKSALNPAIVSSTVRMSDI